MGEVYRARDTKLERDVAIKTLPQEVADDPDRLARFEREARVLASMNHPHIGAIYGFEDATTSDGLRVRGLVLELVEGDTLADRVMRGPIPVSEALAMARQIAAALDAAHQRGIVHRDLKPANVKITPAGVVKVLDFGLAKTSADDLRDRGAMLATIEGTREGVVLGTTPYMSPEQARGLPLDKRTDIWAFGCVLFEMLSGRRAFAGPTISDTIATILQREPDWSAIPRQTPPGVLRLTKRCLEKDPERRLRDLGDADLAIEGPATVAAANPSPRWMLWTATAVAAAAVVAVAALTLTRPRIVPPAPAAAVRFQIPASVNLAESGTFSLSPDGRHLVFPGTDAKGIFRLWIRSLDSLETTPLQGSETERDLNFLPPVVWSPDGRTIAFFSGGKLKRMDRTGGLPRAVCDVPGVGVGGAWSTADVILVGNTAGGLVKCPAGGGPATPATALSPSLKDAAHMLPVFLPDNRHFLYLRSSRSDPSETGLFIGDLDTPADRQSTERLVATPFGGGFVLGAAGDGHVLFVRGTTLMALPFDAERRVATGEPASVATGVGSFRDGAFFYAAGNALVYREAAPQFQLTWLDRRGETKGLVGEQTEFGGATLSPDATRVAMWRPSRVGGSSRELWLADVVRNTSTSFATEPDGDVPAWSVDGRELYFILGTLGGSLNRKAVDGNRPTETLRRPGTSDGPLLLGGSPMAATPDGRFVVFGVLDNKTAIDLWVQPLAAAAKATPLLQQDFDQTDGQLSSDGRWLAYVSNESGINEVFLRPLTRDPVTGAPVVGSSLLVSRGGGMSPRWRKDARELFYQSRGGAVMAVTVDASSVGAPTELFRAPGIQAEWSVTADGQRFLVAAPGRQSAPAFTIVLNWQSTLKR
jgi:Tol biopolymer transport system component/tRNA A-37 threonylcarbamoyl transferase component Bud32